MEAFSPIGANLLPPSDSGAPFTPSGYGDARPTRPSSLRNAITPADNYTGTILSPVEPGTAASKRTFPLIERLQSAIKNIEDRQNSPIGAKSVSFEESISTGVPADSAVSGSVSLPGAITSASAPNQSTLQPTTFTQVPTHTLTLEQIERLIERHHKHLYDQIQTDLHSLHMDMLKQCVAVQKHQEHLLSMYLPQVKELAEELRVLREENARLRSRLAL